LIALAKRWLGDTLVRQSGLMGLTTIALGKGQRDSREVERALGALALPAWLLESRALIAADPFFEAPAQYVAALRDTLRQRPYRMTDYPAVRQQPDTVYAPDVRNYLTGLLSVRLGDAAATRASIAALDEVKAAPRAEVATALAIGLRAEVLRTQGNAAGALAAIERFPSAPEMFTRTFPHWSTRERFLHAELLHAVGRDREALPWYESLGTIYDLPYIAPAHFRCGQIYLRMGNRAAAAFHFTRFVRLWSDADPTLQPLVQEARVALIHIAETSGSR
jgi:tetratricopeptide (TPR) repeat protein